MSNVSVAIGNAKSSVGVMGGHCFIDGYRVKNGDAMKQKNELQAIHVLCELYGSRMVESHWYKLESIVTSGNSVGRIVSESIALFKRSK